MSTCKMAVIGMYGTSVLRGKGNIETKRLIPLRIEPIKKPTIYAL